MKTLRAIACTHALTACVFVVPFHALAFPHKRVKDGLQRQVRVGAVPQEELGDRRIVRDDRAVEEGALADREVVGGWQKKKEKRIKMSNILHKLL